MEVFGNGRLDISGHENIFFPFSPAPVTIGSIEGNGDVFLGDNNLIVGSNNQSTTFSGVMQDGGQARGAGGSLTQDRIRNAGPPVRIPTPVPLPSTAAC